MHCEKNLCDNILKWFLGEKDKPQTCVDMQARGIRAHLWLRPIADNENRLFMPDAPYVLSRNDRNKFLENLRNLKMPSGYVSNLYKRIVDGKLRGLKSHDHHILMQQVLPMCLRDVGDSQVVGTIIRLSRIFRRLCDKVIQQGTKEQLLSDVAEVMVCMEKNFPPNFFDIIVHLMVHFAEELYICGPVHSRWMYPFEQYYKGLKAFVRNLAKPEGSIAQGYEMEEALGFITEYMAHYQPTTRRVWDDKEDPTMTDEVLEGKGKPRMLSDQLRGWLHAFVCDNAAPLEPYREYIFDMYHRVALYTLILLCTGCRIDATVSISFSSRIDSASLSM
jgi:hypothetical protein